MIRNAALICLVLLSACQSTTPVPAIDGTYTLQSVHRTGVVPISVVSGSLTLSGGDYEMEYVTSSIFWEEHVTADAGSYRGRSLSAIRFVSPTRGGTTGALDGHRLVISTGGETLVWLRQ